MVSSICEIAKSGRRPAQTEIVFAGLVDEENAQRGSRALAASGLKADLAIVGEPTRAQIVTAHKGDLWLQLETRGKSAHGARPELGRNAVHEMARVVDLLENRVRHPVAPAPAQAAGLRNRQRRRHQWRHPANIVPDRCTISIDRRTLPGETESSVRREIQSLLRRNELQAVIRNGKPGPCLPLETNPGIPLATHSCARRTARLRWVSIIFAMLRCWRRGHSQPSSFGPGDIAQAHTADEWISLASLERAHALLRGFCNLFLEPKPAGAVQVRMLAAKAELPPMSQAAHRATFFRHSGWLMIANIAAES